MNLLECVRRIFLEQYARHLIFCVDMDIESRALLSVLCSPEQASVRAVSKALRTMRTDFVHHYMHELGPGGGVRATRDVLVKLVVDFQRVVAYAGVLMTRARRTAAARQFSSQQVALACVCLAAQMLDDFADESTDGVFAEANIGRAVSGVFSCLGYNAWAGEEEVEQWRCAYLSPRSPE